VQEQKSVKYAAYNNGHNDGLLVAVHSVQCIHGQQFNAVMYVCRGKAASHRLWRHDWGGLR